MDTEKHPQAYVKDQRSSTDPGDDVVDATAPEVSSDNNVRMQLYSDYQKELWAGRQSSFAEFDRALLSLSSGSLVLSLAFLKDVVPVSQVFWLPLLFVSWVLFLASIACILLSFVKSQQAYDAQLALAQKYYVEKDETAFNAENEPSAATDRLNKAAGILFVLALLTTLFFVGPNMWVAAKVSPVSKSQPFKTPKGTPATNGLIPPGMASVPLDQRGGVPPAMPRVPVQKSPPQHLPTPTPTPTQKSPDSK
ncbi:MAG: hypothetical protein GC160_21575 [Acidobacteria bacterium]|nr:hypothetical protein [Acidobacteriota bacterium]